MRTQAGASESDFHGQARLKSGFVCCISESWATPFCWNALEAPKALPDSFAARYHASRTSYGRIYIPVISYLEHCVLVYSSPRLALTFALHLFLNSLVSSRHNLAASTLAGLSSLGLLSILMTLSRIVSGVWTGDQRSAADS